ncbi:MAG TPA: anthranilate synthase component I family protein [bacterium]|nr:anthranilate synthase component I family protein [bacterium]
MPFAEFRKLAKPGCRVPLVGEIPMDLETPLAVYKAFEKEDYRFLLESVERGEKWGRYSFIGLYPSVVFKASADRLDELKKTMNQYRFVPTPGLPIFPGGAVGIVAYDAVRSFEKIPDRKTKGVDLPDLYFVVPQILLVSDSYQQTLKIVYDARIAKASSVKSEYERGCRMIKKVAAAIAARHPAQSRKAAKREEKPHWKASISSEEHARGVARIRDYIMAGDVTQCVYAIRFQSKLKMDDLELYRALRRVNPSPYMFHLKFDGTALVGASPETMVRLEDGEMTLRPIAGTRRRGRDDAHDAAMEKELLADQKERAEHIMLVDLGRNDLGRVAEAGSVKVDELMKIERYSHVMHIVSNVRAKLAQGKDAFDLLKATFPAGTLSGSPKIRAMQIIEELEPVRRSFYGGCVGYFSFSGNMEMAITIRSALLQNGIVTLQAGGGIVADSVPAMEYKEIVNKSKAVMRAIEMVCKGE